MARPDTHTLPPRFLLPAGATYPYSARTIPRNVPGTAALPGTAHADANIYPVAHP